MGDESNCPEEESAGVSEGNGAKLILRLPEALTVLVFIHFSASISPLTVRLPFSSTKTFPPIRSIVFSEERYKVSKAFILLFSNIKDPSIRNWPSIDVSAREDSPVTVRFFSIAGSISTGESTFMEECESDKGNFL